MYRFTTDKQLRFMTDVRVRMKSVIRGIKMLTFKDYLSGLTACTERGILSPASWGQVMLLCQLKVFHILEKAVITFCPGP